MSEQKVTYSESGTQSGGLHYWRNEYVFKKGKWTLGDKVEVTPQEFASHMLATGDPYLGRWAKRALKGKQFTASMR